MTTPKALSGPELLEKIRSARASVIILVEQNGDVDVNAGGGILEGKLPDFLRECAAQLDAQGGMSPVQPSDITPFDRCVVYQANCPTCTRVLCLPSVLGCGVPGIVVANVCACGEFLAVRGIAPQGIAVSLMTDQEYEALPQEMREQMLAARNAILTNDPGSIQ